MKIGLVTYHRSSSYGACLQAYATQQALCEMGNEVVIIDYLNKYEQRIKKVFFSADGSIKSFVVNAIKSIVFRRNYWLYHSFENFYKEYKLTSNQFFHCSDMQELSFDLLAVGSDQVWNSNISGKIDPVYLLDFGKAEYRISIASSFGSYILNNEEKQWFIKAISQFDSISVREEFAKQQLASCGFENVTIISDPTMFLKRESWESFMVSNNERGYILTYFVSASFCEFFQMVENLKEKYKKPVLNIQSSAFHWNGVDKTIVGITPQQFLGYIHDADIIITDSFHGVVFSILFNKQFIVINNAQNPVRIRELLKKIGLEDVEYNISNKIVELNDELYSNINIIVDELRNESIKWIKNATQQKHNSFGE